MTIPNIITVFRLFIAVVDIVLMFFNFWIVAFVFGMFFWILDAVDGNLARRLKQVTNQGVFLDLISDKFLMVSTFLMIGLKLNVVFFYLGLLMLFRDCIMDFLRLTASSKSMIIFPDKIGKLKGIMFIVSMMGTIFNEAILNSSQNIRVSMIILASLGIILGYITLVITFVRNKKILKD